MHNVVTITERALLAADTDPRKSPAVAGVRPTLAPSVWMEVANSPRRRENGTVVPTVSQSNTPTSNRIGSHTASFVKTARVRPSTSGVPAAPTAVARSAAKPAPQVAKKTDEYYDVKTQIFGALIDTIDLSQLAKMDSEQAREEIRDLVNDIITVTNVVLSISEPEELLEDICNDVLGYGPLGPLLARDDISDIMVNGAGTTFIEVEGKVLETNVRFRDNGQLLNVCQRIVSQVGRRVELVHGRSCMSSASGRGTCGGYATQQGIE